MRPPRDSQRDWLLHQVMDEFAADLEHLDRVAARFVRGSESRLRDDYPDVESAALSSQEIMEDWQTPVMAAMASACVQPGSSVLEVGYGRGVAAEFVQGRDPSIHTVVEVNTNAIETYFRPWRARHAEADIRLLAGRWQDVVDPSARYDGILFHAFPLNESEFIEHVVNSVTYAEHAMPAMAALLAPGGAFTYLSTEIDSLSRRHQRLLFRHFDEISLQPLTVDVPEDTQDAWWADSMIVVVARKR